MYLKKILNTPFIKGVVVLASGTAVAQMIGLFSSPIITRLYGPEAFGIMGVFIALIHIIRPISALTYPIAIVLPNDDRNAKQLMKLSFYAVLLVSALTFITVVVFKESITVILDIKPIEKYLFLIPIVILFAGIIQIQEQWLIRTKQFAINAKVSLSQSLVVNASKIGIGLFHPYASVLIIINVFADGVKSLIFVFFTRKSKYKINFHDNKNVMTIKELAIKYKDFPLFRAPEVLLNSFSQRLPVLILTSFFGVAAAGFYTLGNTVLQQPIRLIGNSVGDVFYPRISEARNKNESMSRLIIKSTIVLALLGFIPFSVIIFGGPWIFSLVFGEEWYIAGKYAQWIGIFLFFEFINKPSVKALPVLSAQLFHLVLTLVTTVIRVLALIVGYYVYKSDIISIALFSISSALIHLFLILIVINKCKNIDRLNQF